MLLEIPKLLTGWTRKGIIALCQSLIILVAFGTALVLLFDRNPPADLQPLLGRVLWILVLVKLVCFGFFRQFSGWWRYVSLPDLITLVKANLLASGLVYGVLLFAGLMSVVPWSLLVLDGLFCFLIMSAVRVSVRVAREHSSQTCGGSGPCDRTLIVGAGATGQSLAREIHQNPKLRMQVIGFVDQDENRLKHYFQGHPVLGGIDEVPALIRKHSIRQVLLANPVLSQNKLQEILGFCQEAGAKAKILPKMDDILNSAGAIQKVRDVRFEDLLGRPAVQLDTTAIRECFGGRSILVTGAAGSIGSEVCRQVARFGARTVVLFDNAETPLFQAERALRREFPSLEIRATLSDVRSRIEVEQVLGRHRPDVIFHAAAYKHVPMAEENPVAAIENNVLGTRTLVEAADRAGISQFVMISTDKAVNPTNIMGASKRAAEIYVQALARTSRTRMVTVRFGNVLGSNGSVVPIFQEQISHGGPVTVTHADATRFFMTIPEAVQLVLQAGSMGQGGEIFLLDMGEQVPIVKLAEALILLSGLKPYKDIDIMFTGLRPGEKMHEELLLDDEGILPTRHSKICVAQAACQDLHYLRDKFARLAEACLQRDQMLAVKQIAELVPQYRSVALCEWISLRKAISVPPERRLVPRPKEGLAGTVIGGLH